MSVLGWVLAINAASELDPARRNQYGLLGALAARQGPAQLVAPVLLAQQEKTQQEKTKIEADLKVVQDQTRKTLEEKTKAEATFKEALKVMQVQRKEIEDLVKSKRKDKGKIIVEIGKRLEKMKAADSGSLAEPSRRNKALEAAAARFYKDWLKITLEAPPPDIAKILEGSPPG